MCTDRDVYYSELIKLGNGLPIYEPDPSDQFDKVRVGDVGYVDRFGRFHRMFNVFLPKDHPINLQDGTPDDFVPLPESSSRTFRNTPLPAGAMHSSSVRVIGATFGAEGSCMPANATIKFSFSNQRGAALVIKHLAVREDARFEKVLENYMLRHYQSWLTFMQDLGCPIKLEDIVLVTGCDLTADWATVTFTERATQCEVEFKVGDLASGTSGTMGFWGTWHSSKGVPHRCGPVSVYPPGELASRGDVKETSPRDAGMIDGRKFNQCIFLRGFHVRERKFRTPKIIKAGADPEDLDMDRDDGASPVLPSFVQEVDSDDSMSDSDPHCYDKPHLANSIYNAVFDYIFKKTDADVAILHDNDICSLVKFEEMNVDGPRVAKLLDQKEACTTTCFSDNSLVKVRRIFAGNSKDNTDSYTYENSTYHTLENNNNRLNACKTSSVSQETNKSYQMYHTISLSSARSSNFCNSGDRMSEDIIALAQCDPILTKGAETKLRAVPSDDYLMKVGCITSQSVKTNINSNTAVQGNSLTLSNNPKQADDSGKIIARSAEAAQLDPSTDREDLKASIKDQCREGIESQDKCRSISKSCVTDPSGSQRNTSRREPLPCGLCSAVMKKCRRLPSDPTLCARCKSKNLPRCPPYVPRKMRKDRYESISSGSVASQISTPQTPPQSEESLPTPPPQPQHATYYTKPYLMDVGDQVHGQTDGGSSLHPVSSHVAIVSTDNFVGGVEAWEATYPRSEPLWYPSLSHVATTGQAEIPSDFQSAMYYM